MKRLIFILLFVLIIFSGLVFYQIKSKQNHAKHSECDETKENSINLSQKANNQKVSSLQNRIKGIECVNGKRAAANQVLVTFQDNLSETQIVQILSNFDIEKSYKVYGINTYVITTKQTTTSKLIEQFSNINEVVSVSPDYVISIGN